MSNLHTRDIGVAIILGTAWKKHNVKGQNTLGLNLVLKNVYIF